MNYLRTSKLCLVLFFIYALCVTGCSHPTQSDVKIGNYTVSPIAGWDRQLSHGRLSKSVKYFTIQNGSAISITFIVFNTPNGVSPPATVDDLKGISLSADQTDKDMGILSKTTVSIPDQYRGLPAYKTEKQSTSGAERVTARFLDFTDGENLYRFHLVVRHLASSNGSDKIAEQAWTDMLANLK